MKKIIALSLLCCMLVTTFVYSSNEMTASPVPTMASAPQKSKKARTYYYVVFGSYSSLKNAKKGLYNTFYFDFDYFIYEVTVKGKKYYRVAMPCSSRAEAESFINDVNNYYGECGAWIWSTQTKPKCVGY